MLLKKYYLIDLVLAEILQPAVFQEVFPLHGETDPHAPERDGDDACFFFFVEFFIN